MATAAISVHTIRGAICTIVVACADNSELEGDGTFSIDSSIGGGRTEAAADSKASHLRIYAVHVVIIVDTVDIIHFHK